MKRVLILGTVVVLLLIGFAMAQESDTANSNNLGEINKSLRNINISDLEGVGGEFKGKANEFLGKEVNIPENLRIPSRFILGLKPDDHIDVQTFVVLVGLWVIFLLLFYGFAKIIPGSEKSYIALLEALAITAVISGLGVTLIASGSLLEVVEKLPLVENWGSIKILLVVIFLLALAFIVLKTSKTIRKHLRLLKADKLAENIAVEREMSEKTAEMSKSLR